MKDLYFATSNSWKFKQAKDYFAEQGVGIKQFDVDILEPREEDGEKVARLKARTAFNKLQKPLFVLDGSFEIKALNGFPKTYVKLLDKYIGTKGILKLLDGEDNRRWEFHNVLYYKDQNIEKWFDGITRGSFAEKVPEGRRTKVRDFERIMIPDRYKITFSQMTDKEYEDYDDKIWKPNVFDSFINWFKGKE